MLQRLKNNIVTGTAARIGKLLSPTEKSRGIRLAFLTILGAAIDVIGLAALVPVMMAATDPTFVTTNTYMAALQTWTGFDYPGFMIFLAVALLLIFIFKNGVALFINYAQSRFAFSVATSLARRQYIKYYGRGYSYFKDTNSADIINNIINIPAFFASGILISTINFGAEMLVMAFIVFGIAAVDIALFLALIAVLLPSGLIIYNGTKNKLYNLGQERKTLHMQTYARLNQAIFGYVDVKLNNKEQYFLDAYVTRQNRLNNNQKTKYLISLIPTRSLEVIAVLGIVVIFLYTFIAGSSGSGADESKQLFGFIAVFAAAAFRVLPSMNRLLAALMGIKNHLFAVEVLEEGALPYELDDQDIRPVKFEETIEFRDVTFQYEDTQTPAVSGLSFTVAKGEKIGIIGESGSGKTTLMNLLLRFLAEDSGGLYVDGKRLERDDVPGWRAIVGYVQQKVYLMDASLKENVAFGEDADKIDAARLQSALEQASLSDFVASLPQGIETPVGEMGGKLSGGQQQRMGIARALYWNSKILVFDEATSALDMETEEAITESIERLSDGQTLFVIAHRITTLRNCDRILEMKDGKLVREWQYNDLIDAKLKRQE